MLIVLAFENEEERSKYHRIYMEHSANLRRLAWKILNDEALADDAVQECFLKLFLHIKNLENASPDKEIAYVTQILKYSAFDILRKKKKQPNITEWEEEALNYIEDDFALDEVLAKTERIEELVSEINRLNEIERIIILQHFFFEKSFAEIGKLLNMSEGSLRVRLLRAKRKLVRQMNQAEGGELR